MTSEKEIKKRAKKIAEEEFENLVKEYLPLSNSLNNLCNYLGLKGVDGYYKKIKNVIEKYNLSTEHFGTLKTKKNSHNAYTAMTNEEFFVNGENRTGEQTIKRLISNNLKEYKCEICGINEWKGKPLRLQVHHINGKHNDNRLDNLQLLCPNCHSQTDTYAKKNLSTNENKFTLSNRINEIVNNETPKFKKPIISNVYKKSDFIKYCEFCGKEIKSTGTKFCSEECSRKASIKFNFTKDEIIEVFKELKTYTSVGKKYGVSDNAIRKRLKKMGIYDEIQKIIKGFKNKPC